ncbi:MAG: septum formation initiator family protein [Paracoccaceae bacterium]|jgi:cell division protein FtsB|nr:septum formation initiator family protein [Paracoccaceae bacterium]
MTNRQKHSAVHGALVTLGAFLLGTYFVFHAVQGEYGLFNRVQIEAEESRLTAELSDLQAQLDALQNKTRRLSDGFLDLDLLDERARDVLGYGRPNEILFR